MASGKRTTRRVTPRQQPSTLDSVTITSFVSHPEVTEARPSALSSNSSQGASDMPLENDDHATSLLGMFAPIADVDNAPSQRAYASLSRTGVTAPIQHPSAHTALIAEGAGLLDLLIHFDTDTDDLSMQRIAGEEGMTRRAFVTEIVWKAVGSFLEDLRATDSLSNLNAASRLLLERTARPLVMPVSATDLSAAFSGECLRWETIALYCAELGLVLGDTHSSNPYPKTATTVDRKAMMQKAFSFCMQCESLCERLGQANDITLWQLEKAIALSTWCFGDDSYLTWQLTGKVAGVVYALGWHNGIKDDDTVPLYLRETRKRTLCEAYATDIEIATFVGRPPRLNRRYLVLNLPSDVSNSVTLGPTNALEAAIATLGRDGWDRDNAVHPASFARLHCLLNGFREETLELTLGPAPSDLISQAHSVLTRLVLTWQSIPHLTYEVTDWDAIPKIQLLILLYLRLEYLYTKFLLHKLLTKHGGDRSPMVETAHELLDLVLLRARQREVVMAHRIDIEWTAVFYAMPSASVLLVELLRPRRQQVPFMSLKRATAIRNISSLVACCDWLTAAGESNFDLCKQAQSVFSKVLDSVLNAVDEPATAEAPQQPAVPRNDEASYGFLNDAPAVFDLDPEWTAWLDSLGLQPDTWLDSLNHPEGDFVMR